MKVLITGGGTGGHLMPALALARAAADMGHEPVLVGAQRGIEAQLLPRHSFRFHLLPIEPLYRRQWWRNVLLPLTMWRARRAADRVLRDERPASVIGTGGYAAGPVIWRAQDAGIPTVLQEQNAFPGITTRFFARRARQIHLGFPEARARLRPGPHTEIFAFGNPVVPPVALSAAAARASFGLAPDRATVFVLGGSQGARAINKILGRALQNGLLGAVNVLWGTGTAHEARYAPHAVSGRVVVRGFFDPIAPAYAAADLVVARAGAMTVAELCAWGKPSILIPLPTAAADHQTFNARALETADASLVLPEAGLLPEVLAEGIERLLRDADRLRTMGRAAQTRGHPDAARAIMSKVLTLVGGD